MVSKEEDEFIIGKAKTLKEGSDLTVIACGNMVCEALEAAQILQEQGVSV